MNYSNDVIRLAYEELDRRRETAAAVHDSHVEDIRIGFPEIYRIYLSITSTKDRLASLILSKGVNVKNEISKIRDENLRSQEELKSTLQRFGFPEDFLEVKYFCPICCDTGISAGNRCSCVNELLERFSVKKLNEQCKIKLHSFAEFDLSYYPESYTYRGQTINAHDMMDKNLRICIDYVKNFSISSPGLLFFGGTGLGKTFLSSCIANELLNKGFSVAFDSIQNYLLAIENEHFGRTNGSIDTINTLLSADLVILDDLGSEFNSQFNLSNIYNIINSRINMGKPTIVSTNLSLDELSHKYDDRIISRLTGMFLTLRFIGKDIRQMKHQKGLFI